MSIKVSVAVAVWAAAAAAWEANPGGDAAAPSSWGLGARADALGRAYGALADDVAAAYWNPAGLAGVARTEISFGYGAPFTSVGDVAIGDAAAAKPLAYSLGEEAGGAGSLGTLAAALAFRRAGGIYEAGDGGLTGRTFADTDVELYLAYAHAVGKKAAFGLALKDVTRNVGAYQDSGFGLDAGVDWRPVGALTVGAVARNLIAPNFELKELEDAPPLTLELSGCYKVGRFAALVAGSELTRETFYDAGAGVELTPVKYVALRGGYWTGDGRLRAGIGLALGDFRFDYAARFGGALGDSQLASVSFLFGGPPATQSEKPPEEEGYIEYHPGESGEVPGGENAAPGGETGTGETPPAGEPENP